MPSSADSYSLIAFDKRVTFWLQRVRSLPCECAYVSLFARRLAYNHYAIAHAYNAANAHSQDSDRARWSQKLLSRRRQSEYKYLCIQNTLADILSLSLVEISQKFQGPFRPLHGINKFTALNLFFQCQIWFLLYIRYWNQPIFSRAI